VVRASDRQMNPERSEYTYVNANGNYANAPIPVELGERLQAAFGLERIPARLSDIAEGAIPRGGLTEEDLCSVEPTRHEVSINAQRVYTHCVMDALLLPLLKDQPAEVRSVSPLGGVVRIKVVPGGGVEAEPADAVMSFGVAREDRGAMQQTACPFINAFPSQAEYERWAAATPEAITMAISWADAVAFSRAAVA
jgi:alkylmercury lyase